MAGDGREDTGFGCGLPCYDLFRVRIDGTGLRSFPRNVGGIGFSPPRWFPDGPGVAFVGFVGQSELFAYTYALFATELRTGDVKQLLPFNDEFPKGGYVIGGLQLVA
jgi:hypothetical protein